MHHDHRRVDEPTGPNVWAVALAMAFGALFIAASLSGCASGYAPTPRSASERPTYNTPPPQQDPDGRRHDADGNPIENAAP